MSNSTDKLALLTEASKAFAPHIGVYSKVELSITWGVVEASGVLGTYVPIVKLVMEK